MSNSPSAQRWDIQALRAVAVSGVVLFHLWPNWIRGGYVGVDVFFVISGFLISSHLLSSSLESGRVALLTFWARRVRRLFPAAMLVLAVSALGTFLLIPQSVWSVQFREIIASALYSENWVLARDSVDYLKAENAPSVAQHYWSLSVEEQFYLVWPLLLAGGAALGSTAATRRRIATVIFGVVLLGSLTASVLETAHAPGPAYFVTFTRAWEFAAGGLVAIGAGRLPQRMPHLCPAIRGAGWLAIAAATFGYTRATPFPSWTALLPALGTAAVIAAGDPGARSVLTRISRSAPVAFLGNISYSLYLWHWPLIIIGGYALPSWSGNARAALLLPLCVVLAAATYYLVENPIRFNPLLVRRRLATFAFGGATAVLVVAMCGAGLVTTEHSAQASAKKTASLIEGNVRCFGAAAAFSRSQPCHNPELDGVLLPKPAARLADTAGAFACYAQKPTADLMVCSYGPKRGQQARVALVGDSHAASLLPALKPQLGRLGWRLDTYIGRGCGWTATPRAGDPCAPHQRALATRLQKERYDVIVVTQRRGQSHTATASRALADAWRPVIARGTRLVAVADNPWIDESTKGCLARATDLESFSSCSMTPEEAWRRPDPLRLAVRDAGGGAHLVDLSRAYCSGKRCGTVIGHVLVYRDEDHITATFSKTLGPYLARSIRHALKGSHLTAD